MPIPALMGTSTHLKREEVPSLDLNFDGTTSSATGDPHFDNVLINLDGTRTTANLLPSIDMSDQTFWQRNTNLGVTSGQTDPFGGTQAHFLNDQNTTSFSSLRETITGVAPGDYTASVYIKKTATAASKFRLRLWLGPLVTGTPTAECAVDTQNGLVSGDPTAKIEVVNSTYYRVSVTGTNVDQTELSLDFIPANAQTYSGAPDPNATGGHTLYKPQIEAGSVATNALIIEGTLTTGTTDGSTIAHPFGNSPVPYIEYGSTPNYQRVPLSVDLSGGDWTMEMWARFDALGSYRSILSSGYAGGWQFGIANNTSQLALDYSGVSVLHTTSLSTGQWYYVTLSYVDATNTIYVGVDGVVVSGSNAAFGTLTSQLLGGSNAASASVGAGHAFVIGSNRNASTPHYGQLTQVRITKGVARYVQTFGNPTTYPPTAKDASVGTRLATSIVTQSKTGTVQSKYMGQHGKLINGYVENKSPTRDPNALTLAGSATRTVTTGQPAPDGSNTAVLFTATSAGSIYGVTANNVSFTSGEHYTLSVYMKVVTGTVHVGPLLTNAAFGAYERAQYTITAGGGAPTLAGGSYRSGSGDYGIQDAGNGWYRLWVSGTATTTVNHAGNQVFRVDGAGVGEEVLVWGLQCEEGVLVPSEFVDATADQVARIEYGNLRTNIYPGTVPANNKITFTTNQGTAPDGTNTAIKATEDSALGEKNANTATISVTSGTQYTMSLFAKPAGRTGIRLLMPSSRFGSDLLATYDLQGSGSIIEWGGSNTPDATTISAAGNGWYRISITGTAANTGNAFLQLVIDNDGTNTSTSYQGDGSSGLLLWGIQVEEGSSVTDYIATEDGARTVGEPLGLLVEEGRTNLLTKSSDLTHSDWSVANSLSVSVSGVGPDGATDAFLLDDQTTGYGRLSQAHTVGAGTYTGTIFVKKTASAASEFSIRLVSSVTTNRQIYVDTQNGVIRGASTGTITPIGTDWYRVGLTITTPSTGSLTLQIWPAHAQTYNSSGDANATGSHIVWGPQIEAGEAATSYIPTDATSLARPADEITLATSSFGYNTAAGTTLADFTMQKPTDSYPRVYEVSSDTNNRDSIFYAAPSTSLRAEVKESSSSTAWELASSVTFPFSAKAIVRHDGSNAVAALDGSLGTAQSITTAPSTTRTRLAFGYKADGTPGNFMIGHIRRLRYWPRAVNDAQLSKFTNQ